MKPTFRHFAGALTLTQITHTDSRIQHATVHNLTIANTHTYYVMGGTTPVLVHNCGDATVFFDGGHATIRTTVDGEVMHTPARRIGGGSGHG